MRVFVLVARGMLVVWSYDVFLFDDELAIGVVEAEVLGLGVSGGGGGWFEWFMVVVGVGRGVLDGIIIILLWVDSNLILKRV